MEHQASNLGSLLRTLLDKLDPAVDRAYQNRGLDYRARFTPIVRALAAHGPMRIKDIAHARGLTHSAVSQTVSAMANRGWIVSTNGRDGRERWLQLTPLAVSHLPQLEEQWLDTAVAAQSLCEEVGVPLEEVLLLALKALERESFDDRIERARHDRQVPRGPVRHASK